MRNWIAAIAAGLIVVAVGTAVASIPGGETTSFNVTDPAVTVIAADQTSTAGGAVPSCEWEAEERIFCFASELTFTPSRDALCLVNADIALYGDPMNTEAGRLTNVGYGIGVRTGESDSITPDENGVTTTPSYLSAQSVSRARLIAVEAGQPVTFEPWIDSYGTSTGRAYWSLAYTCFGA